MKRSIFFYKELTQAEVGKAATNEVYIRFPNNFDYETFFNNSDIQNENVKEVRFNATDLTEGMTKELIPLRFVYFENSNKEKRIPSLGVLFRSHNIGEGDVVCVESHLINENISYIIRFYKKGVIKISPSSVIIEHEETDTRTDTIKELFRHRYAATFLKQTLRLTQEIDNNFSNLEQIGLYEKSGKRLKLNGFPLGRDKDQLPPRISNVDSSISWSYDGQDYVLFLEWNPEDMERMFIPIFNKAYQGLLQIVKDPNGEYILYKLDINIESGMNDLPTSYIQQIFYGTPGSGKSWKIKQLYEMRMENGEWIEDEEKMEHVVRTTFHPDTDYASFVGCYKPIKDKEDPKKITYEFVPQAFTDAYVKAWCKPDEKFYLVIEEINRGNCAQIFGDLFQLLDRKDDGYSEYPIKADEDLKDYLNTKFQKEGFENNGGIKDDKLRLPPNLSIIASMNTSDQSLFPMDSAFKRRWSWEYVPIEYDNPKSALFNITIDDKPYPWHEFLKNVNERIKLVTDSEDKQMGNFFIKKSVDEKEFCDKVMFYLWSEVGKDNYKIPNSVFQWANKDDEVNHFSFNELYTSGNKINTDILKGFIYFINKKSRKEESSGNVGPEPAEEVDANTEQ